MKQNKGFTILELLIATTVFSVVLLIVSSGLIYIGKVYYRTGTQSRTQEAARAIVDEVSQGLQFSGGTFVSSPSGAKNLYCIGNYGYVIDKSSPNSPTFFRNNSCSNTTPGDVDLAPEGLFVDEFSITETPSKIFTISVRVIALPVGDDLSSSLIDSITRRCRGGAGSEYCASVKLETTVTSRL